MKRETVLLFLPVCLFFVISQLQGANTDKFFGFEEPTDIWNITIIKDNAAKKVNICDEKYVTEKHSLKIQLDFPGEGCIEKDFFKNLSIYSSIVVNIYLPGTQKTPDDMKISVMLQDNELLWYQTQKFNLAKGIWNRLTIDVKPGSAFWESIGHSQPWSEKPASGIRKMSIKFFSEQEKTSEIYMDDISGNLQIFPEYSYNSDILRTYEKFELSFNSGRNIQNPFNPDEIKVEGIFTCPEGNILAIPGFYYQNYSRQLENDEEKLSPEGYPCWKIRFTPEKQGTYRYYIRLRQNEEIFLSKENHFTAVAPEKQGFIKTSSVDNRYFVFCDGSFFYPVGLNVRSPTDTRYASLMKRKTEPDSGTFYYEEIFREMSLNGMNFAEVWMAPWFAALEWKENRPGYRGLGYYNLKNAYKLDRVLEFAEKNNIFLQLVIINHGQLSTWCDQEWQDNPYNAANGGFLKTPDEFFTNPEAKEHFKKQLLHITARWGYSPAVFSWEIINEMNLIGSKSNFYREHEKSISAWYREMTAFLRETDFFNHLVTAHYTILAANPILSDIIDFTITNGYYDVKRESLLTCLDNIHRHHSKFRKPAFVSEFGGTSGGSTVENLKRDIIAGLWYGYHKPFAAAPLFWWHRFVKEKELFNIYSVFSEYSSGVDRISSILEEGKAEIEGPGKKQLFASTLENDYFVSCWVYDFAVTKDMRNNPFPAMKDIEIVVKNKKDGRYNVSFYDMEKGLIEKKIIETDSGTLKIQLPPFNRWIAFKAEYYEQLS